MIWDLIDTVNEPILLAGITYCTFYLCRHMAARHEEN